MNHPQQFQPLHAVSFDARELVQIQRNELLPLLDDPYRLNHYADHLVQAQTARLQPVSPALTQQMSQTIEQIVQALVVSKRYLKRRRFNALQKWFGADVEYAAQQWAFYQRLQALLTQATDLSAKLQQEIHASQQRLQQLSELRVQMAKYVQAAQQFIQEFPKFRQQTSTDYFVSRLEKKIHSLQTLQASNDMVMSQMQLSQQLSFSLLDRFKEAEQVLLPAWQYHMQQYAQQDSQQAMQALDQSREQLIQQLKRTR